MVKERITFGKTAVALFLCLMLVVSAFMGTIPVFAEDTPTDSYGTAADGITKTAGNELNSIYLNPSEITTDFSEGLRYWGASETRTGKASDYASVADGVLTVKYHETAPKKFDGIQTVRINIPKEAEGKQIGFVCDVQRTAVLGVKLLTNSGDKAGYYYSDNTKTYSDWYTVSKSALPKETDTYMYMIMQFGNVDPENNIGKEFKVRNLRIGYINDEGIFTQINGELVNTKYNTPYYGTEEKGIYTKDNKGTAGQNLVPFETLKNDNFSEGLKYWSSFGTNAELYASDVAKVENGQLVITAAADANSSYSVMSTGVKIPQGLTGKMLGVAFHVDSPKNQFSVGYRTDAGNSKDGSTFSARPSCRVRAEGSGRGYQIQENDKVVYIYFKQYNNSDADRGGVTTIDDVVLFYYDPSDTTVGYTFDGQRVTLAQGSGNINYYTYGTEEKGIYIYGNNENQDDIPALDDFANMDFSQGLKYWGGQHAQSGIYASKHASVENGILTVTSDGNVYAEVASTPAKVKSEWIGKTMHIFVKVRTDSTDTGYAIEVHTNKLDTKRYSWQAGGDVKGSSKFILKHLQFTFQEGDNTFILVHKVGVKTAGANIQVADTKFAFQNEDGTFTTIDGELLNQYGYEMYGTEKDGIYSGTANGVMGQTTNPLDNAMNFNFSEGLKYWSCYGIKESFASDVAKVENGKLVITATTESGKTSYYKVMSAGVKIPENMEGKHIGVLFDMNSPDAQVDAHIYTNTNTNGKGYTFSKRTARTGLTGDNNTYTVTAEDKVVYVRFQQQGTDGAVTKIDDVILYYYDPNRPDEWYSLDGQPITSKDVLYYTYGTEEKGIYVGGQGATQAPVKNIAALDEITNFDFSRGLKYWGTASKANAYASDVVSVENGRLKLADTADEAYCGIRSVSVNLPKAAKGKNVVVSYDLTSNVQFAVKVHTNSASSDWFSKNSTAEKSVRVTTASYAVGADAQTIAIEMQIYGDRANPTHYALVDNIKIQIVDEGGMEGKYAELNGAPIGYEYGDVNADTTTDIIDLVRLKKYLVNSETEKIYVAAANADKDEEMSITADDLVALRKILLAVE